MKKFDQDGDGSISIDELRKGLNSINVKISEKEKLALMKELDKDRDGGVAEHELYNALAQGSEFGDFTSTTKNKPLGRPSPTVEQLMAKIRRAVSHYKSQQEQIIGLMRIFDMDNDGLISFIELVDGIKQLGI
jgi:Ca2+-binding EF-hand superfamily protein